MEFIKQYFASEKTESLLFLCLGIAAILFASISVWKWHDNMLRGLAIPLALIGIVQVVVGAAVYFRTDGQLADLQALFMRDANTFALEEGKRMEAVMRNFSYFKIVEIVIIVVGLVLLLFLKDKGLWQGIGMGMLIQGSLMLSADIFAEKRGMVYVQGIEYSQKTIPNDTLGPY
jgi:hypothetical protein